MKSILFLCTGNSCRSQMAHGLANSLLSDKFVSYSAGIESHGLNPSAVKVMDEIGIDISHHQSNTLSEFNDEKFDYVVAVCEHAASNCPTFPDQTNVITRQFDDPPKLAQLAKSQEEALSHYRRVRDEIKDWITKLPAQVS
ncbi:arsenate reductase ArsC [Parashewanella spongiae]|uniref:Arsenate reductase ArsC n=1 Tax=Parashewanella spongiae TaxID=342950 RepID=A0A3A6U214_9GAMM|nr:arsenate reductase ArsC [Parashewanella spongiae]MCL1077744.1 arsenate reductase ArsC [Parashewanella spongiae]RJY18055.1 arsenate reductase ArsC [Parashewanella spongiae]